MSQKQKNKEKKSEAQLEVERKYEYERSHNLELELQVREYRVRNSDLAQANHELAVERDALKAALASESDKLQLNVENFKNRLGELTSAKNQMEVEAATVKARLEMQQKEQEEWRREREKEIEEQRRYYINQLGKCQLLSQQHAQAILERDQLIRDKQQICQELIRQRERFRSELADKEREKIQSMDTMAREMGEKFREMKGGLMAVHKQQLSATTRLTHLHNQQLLKELTYQSRKTQQIADHNLSVQRQAHELNNQNQLLTQTQNQLATRTALSKQALLHYKKEVERLTQENDGLRKAHKSMMIQEKDESLGPKVNQLSHLLLKTEGKVKDLEVKLVAKQTQLAGLKQKNKNQISEINNLGRIALEIYSQVIKQDSFPEQVSLQRIRSEDVSEWTFSEKEAVLLAVLNKLRPKLELSQISLQLWRKTVEARLAPEKHKSPLAEDTASSSMIKDVSLLSNKLYYQSRRRLSSSERKLSLHRSSSLQGSSLGKVVQGRVREWGPQPARKHQLAQRFMKPLRHQLK